MVGRQVAVAPNDGETTEVAAPKKKQWAGKSAKGTRKPDERKRPMTAHDGRDQLKHAANDVHEEHDENWVRPSSLPSIPPRPGYVQRWIRVASGGKVDASNISRRHREGWRPRRAETVPKNIGVPTLNNGEYAGCVGVEGSILMEMTVERNEQRNTFYQKQRARQTESVDETLAKEAKHDNKAFGEVRRGVQSQRVREVAVGADE